MELDHIELITEGDIDIDYNPLVDAANSSSEESVASTANGNDHYAEILQLRQHLVNQKDEIVRLKEDIERMETRCTTQESGLNILRSTIRRLRFSNTNKANQRSRSDQSFIDGSRRKFLNAWEGNMEYFTAADPTHLAFIGHLLDLPTLNNED
jgi:hypothetical protein